MSSSGQIDARRDFFAIAGELSFLPPGAAEELAAEAHSRGLHPSTLALQKGLLTAAQIDIVETLRAPGEAIPGYEILGLIGYGGMGVVYRARQQNLSREVAIKTVLLSELAEPTAAQRFEQEATLVARLAHPNIVTAYDFGKHAGRLYLVMELLSGEDADRRVRRSGGLAEPLAWSLIRQAAGGLAHALASGIIHRDIKPANLLLVERPAGFPLPDGVPLVKITDFGLARLSNESADRTRLTSANATLGSPHYMSPEQFRGEDVDHRADIYGLGASAWHLLAGQPPLAGRPMSQIIASKISGPLPDVRTIRPDASAASAELIASLVAPSVADRPADYAQVLQRIDALGLSGVSSGSFPVGLAGGLALAAAPTQPLQKSPTLAVAPAKPAIDRRRWLWLAAGLGALAVGGTITTAIMSRPRALGQPDLVPTGRAGSLFDGLDIDHWRTVSGGWYPGRNDDQALVLEGSGVVRRAIALPGADRQLEPLSHYRLILFVQLHEASAIEVQFDLATASSAGPRFCLRLTADGSQLGRRAGDTNGLTFSSGLVPHVVAADRPHVVQIERHSRGWWIWVDEQLVGAVRQMHQNPVTEFRLLVEGSSAWFSDVTLEELGAAPK